MNKDIKIIKDLQKTLTKKQKNLLNKLYALCLRDGPTPFSCLLMVDLNNQRKPSKKAIAAAKKLEKKMNRRT